MARTDDDPIMVRPGDLMDRFISAVVDMRQLQKDYFACKEPGEKQSILRACKLSESQVDGMIRLMKPTGPNLFDEAPQ